MSPASNDFLQIEASFLKQAVKTNSLPRKMSRDTVPLATMSATNDFDEPQGGNVAHPVSQTIETTDLTRLQSTVNASSIYTKMERDSVDSTLLTDQRTPPTAISFTQTEALSPEEMVRTDYLLPHDTSLKRSSASNEYTELAREGSMSSLVNQTTETTDFTCPQSTVSAAPTYTESEQQNIGSDNLCKDSYSSSPLIDQQVHRTSIDSLTSSVEQGVRTHSPPHSMSVDILPLVTKNVSDDFSKSEGGSITKVKHTTKLDYSVSSVNTASTCDARTNVEIVPQVNKSQQLVFTNSVHGNEPEMARYDVTVTSPSEGQDWKCDDVVTTLCNQSQELETSRSRESDRRDDDECEIVDGKDGTTSAEAVTQTLSNGAMDQASSPINQIIEVRDLTSPQSGESALRTYTKIGRHEVVLDNLPGNGCSTLPLIDQQQIRPTSIDFQQTEVSSQKQAVKTNSSPQQMSQDTLPLAMTSVSNGFAESEEGRNMSPISQTIETTDLSCLQSTGSVAPSYTEVGRDVISSENLCGEISLSKSLTEQQIHHTSTNLPTSSLEQSVKTDSLPYEKLVHILPSATTRASNEFTQTEGGSVTSLINETNKTADLPWPQWTESMAHTCTKTKQYSNGSDNFNGDECSSMPLTDHQLSLTLSDFVQAEALSLEQSVKTDSLLQKMSVDTSPLVPTSVTNNFVEPERGIIATLVNKTNDTTDLGHPQLTENVAPTDTTTEQHNIGSNNLSWDRCSSMSSIDQRIRPTSIEFLQSEASTLEQAVKTDFLPHKISVDISSLATTSVTNEFTTPEGDIIASPVSQTLETTDLTRLQSTVSVAPSYTETRPDIISSDNTCGEIYSSTSLIDQQIRHTLIDLPTSSLEQSVETGFPPYKKSVHILPLATTRSSNEFTQLEGGSVPSTVNETNETTDLPCLQSTESVAHTCTKTERYNISSDNLNGDECFTVPLTNQQISPIPSDFLQAEASSLEQAVKTDASLQKMSLDTLPLVPTSVTNDFAEPEGGSIAPLGNQITETMDLTHPPLTESAAPTDTKTEQHNIGSDNLSRDRCSSMLPTDQRIPPTSIEFLQLEASSLEQAVETNFPTHKISVDTSSLATTSVSNEFTEPERDSIGSFLSQTVETLSLIHISEPTRPY